MESASQEVEGSDGLQPAIHGVGEREQPQSLKRKASADHGTGPDLESGEIAAAGAGPGAAPRGSASDTAEATSVAREGAGASKKRRLVTDVDTDMLPTPYSTEINTVKDEYQQTRRRGDEMPHGDLGVARARAPHRTAPRPPSSRTDASTRRAVSPTTPIKQLLQRGPDTRLTPPSSGLLQISSPDPGDPPLTSATRAAAPTPSTPIRRVAFSAEELPRHLPTPPPTLPRLVRVPAPGALAEQPLPPGGSLAEAVATATALARAEVEVKVEPGTPIVSIDDLPDLPDLPVQPDVREDNGGKVPSEARHDPSPLCSRAPERPSRPVTSELQQWHDLVSRTNNAAKMRHPVLPADASITAHIEALAGMMAEKDHIIQTLKDEGAVRASRIDWLVMERSTGTFIRPRPPQIDIAARSNTFAPPAMPSGIPQALLPAVPPAPSARLGPPPSTVAEWASQFAPPAVSPAVPPVMQQGLPLPSLPGASPPLPLGGYPLMPPAMPFAVPPDMLPNVPPAFDHRPQPIPFTTEDWANQHAPQRVPPPITSTMTSAMPFIMPLVPLPPMPLPGPPETPLSMPPAMPPTLSPPPTVSGPAQPWFHTNGAALQQHYRLEHTQQSAPHYFPESRPQAEPQLAQSRPANTSNTFMPYLQTPLAARVPASAPPTMITFPLQRPGAQFLLGHRPAVHQLELTPNHPIPPHPPRQLFPPMSDPVPSGPTHLSGGMSAALPRWHPWTTSGLALPPSGNHHFPPHHLATAEPDRMPPAGLRSAPLVRTAVPTPLAGTIPAPVAVTQNTLQPQAHTPTDTTLQASRKSSPLTAAAPTAPTLLTATDNNYSPPHQLGAAIHLSAAGSNATRDRARERQTGTD